MSERTEEKNLARVDKGTLLVRTGSTALSAGRS